MSFGVAMHKRLSVLLAAPPVIVVFSLLINNSAVEMATTSALILFLTCAIVFALADLMVGRLEQGFWAGYMNLTALVMWLVAGIVAGISVVFVGALFAYGFRTLKQEHRFTRTNLLSNGEMVLWRLAINGNSVLVAYSVFMLFDFDSAVFLNSADIIQLQDVVPIALALGMSFLTTQVLGAYVTRVPLARLSTLSLDRDRVLWEILPFVVTPAIAMTYERAGIVVFVTIMTLVGAQILRYRQLGEVKNSLSERVNELSTVNRISEAVTSSLVLDDVLKNIHAGIADLVDICAIYVALYNADQSVVEYPYVVVDNKPRHWQTQPLPPKDDLTDLTGTVLNSRTILHVNHEDIHYRGLTMPEAIEFHDYVGLPLITGTKLLGMLAVMKPIAFTAAEVSILRTIATQINLGVRNTMLYGRSVELADNLTVINNSLQNVIANLDHDDALQLACETATTIADAEYAAIFLQNTQDDRPAYLAHCTGFTPAHCAELEKTEYLPDIYDEDTILISDVRVRDADDPIRQAVEAVGCRSMMQVPLKSSIVAIGVLRIYFKEAHILDDMQVQLLESLAYQMTAALDNAELMKALEVYASEQAQLVHLSRVLNETLEKDVIVEQSTHIIRQIIGVENVWIGLKEGEENDLTFYSKQKSLMPTVIDVTTIPEFQSIFSAHQYISRIFYADGSDISVPLTKLMKNNQMKLVGCVPMVISNGLMGIMMFGHVTARNFSDSEWRMLDLATNQVATQLNNAQLYEESQDALKRRLHQLSLLDDIARQISGAFDRDVMIRNVLDATAIAIDADLAALGLITDSGEFRIIGQENHDGEWQKYEIIRPPYEGLMGQVINTGKALLIPENSAEETYIADGTLLMRSSLIVPLIMNETVIGVLNVESHKSNNFTQEHLEFAKSLAGHAVISIQNSQLLDERQGRIETLISLRDLSIRLAGNSVQSAVYEGIVRTALDISQGVWALLYNVERHGDEIELICSMDQNGDIRNDDAPWVPIGLVTETLTDNLQVVENTAEDIHFIGSQTEDVYNSLVCAPIRYGNETRQILCILYPNRRYFSAIDLNAIDLLTIQSASQLENFELLERIRTESNRMSAILESNRDGIMMLDRNGTLVLYNTSVERLLNADMSQFLSQHFAMAVMRVLQNGSGFSPGTDDLLKQMARVLRLEPTTITNRSYLLEQEDRTRHLEEVGSPVYDADNQVIGRLITMRDVTEEKELEQYRDEITHMVIHDLRRPLGSIITSLDAITLILEDFGEHPSSDVVKQVIGVSMDSANSLLNLVDTLLDIAKMEKPGFMVLKPEIVPLRGVIDTASRHLSSFMDDAQISLDVVLPEDLPSVNIDQDLILRVVRNLLDNAIRYAPTGGKVQISAEPHDNEHVMVRVADNGRGIPPAEVERIFDKYRQIKDNIPVHGGKSTGIGLTFCKQAVEAHHGKIWVDNAGPLPGACFYFTLPTNPQEFNIAEQTETEVIT